MWLLFAACAGLVCLWLEPRLPSRHEARKGRVVDEETAPYWGGGPPAEAPRSVAGSSTNAASYEWLTEPEGQPIRLPPLPPLSSPEPADAHGPPDPALADAALAEASFDEGTRTVGAQEGAADGNPVGPGALADAGAPDAAADAADDGALVAAADADPSWLAQADGGIGWDPNGPLLVPLYTAVPMPQAPAHEQLPTLGGGAIGAGGAGGFTSGFTGGGAGGAINPSVGAAGGTSVGSAGAFGVATPPAAAVSPLAIRVAWVLTPYGWILLPIYPITF